MRKLFILSNLFLLSVCTTAGPFVTNITQNRDGTFSIEKCMVEHNAFTGAIRIVQCTRS